MAVEVLNLNTLSRDHLRDEWPSAQRVIDTALDATGFGRGFGWRLYIKIGHRHKQAKKDGLLVVQEDGLHRRVLVRTRAANSWIHFDVWVSWDKKDVPVAEVARSLRAAGQHLGDDGPAEPDDGVATTPVAPTAVAAVPDLDEKLLKMQSGIGRLLELSRDMKAVAQLKAEAERRLRAAEAAAAGPREAKDRLAGRLADLNDEWDALTRQAEEQERAAAEARARLDRTRGEMERVKDQAAVVRTDLAAARATADPLAAELAAAEQGLREVEAAERERADSLSKAGDLSALLAALEKLG